MFAYLDKHKQSCPKYALYRKEREIDATICLRCGQGGREYEVKSTYHNYCLNIFAKSIVKDV